MLGFSFRAGSLTWCYPFVQCKKQKSRSPGFFTEVLESSQIAWHGEALRQYACQVT